MTQAVARWDTIPGVDRVSAWALLAEIGDNVPQFPTAEHLASWAALCPGNSRKRRQAFARCNPSSKPMVVPHGLSMRLGCRAKQEHLLFPAVQTLSSGSASLSQKPRCGLLSRAGARTRNSGQSEPQMHISKGSVIKGAPASRHSR
jgi:hypothetical protein